MGSAGEPTGKLGTEVAKLSVTRPVDFSSPFISSTIALTVVYLAPLDRLRGGTTG